MTPKEVARLVGLSEKTVRQRLREKKLSGEKVGGRWQVRRSDVDAFLSARARQ